VALVRGCLMEGVEPQDDPIVDGHRQTPRPDSSA
jgi:hypothetical protein